MGMLIQCNNAKCCKLNEALLDVASDKVYCALCSKEITAITQFAKKNLKSTGQVKKSKPTSTFSAKCGKCSFTSTPKLIKGTLVCGECAEPLENLSKPFEEMVKDFLKRSSQ